MENKIFLPATRRCSDFGVVKMVLKEQLMLCGEEGILPSPHVLLDILEPLLLRNIKFLLFKAIALLYMYDTVKV